ncbi:hypothetical protein [Streptomyces sp. KL116D]|uniref:hypothetical protein n=1 Tax=Streptomyces sp. KL116D TaxID=3045152 RepID=UPI0035589EF7
MTIVVIAGHRVAGHAQGGGELDAEQRPHPLADEEREHDAERELQEPHGRRRVDQPELRQRPPGQRHGLAGQQLGQVRYGA